MALKVSQQYHCYSLLSMGSEHTLTMLCPVSARGPFPRSRSGLSLPHLEAVQRSPRAPFRCPRAVCRQCSRTNHSRTSFQASQDVVYAPSW
ncbi:hypothetical protein M3J09_012641 [Ascochyta lentis]